MRTKRNITLSGNEYNVINKLTSQTKADCWFCVDTDDEGFDCVKDLEKGYKVTLRFALDLLNDAIIPELVDLTDFEKLVYDTLMDRLGLDRVFTSPEPTLKVCDHCLCAIESREGNQVTRTIYADADTELKCDWCGEIEIDKLYELL